LQNYNLIVTPHSCTFNDTETMVYYEMGMLSKGVYNLGFLATRRSETTFAFLDWWQKRLRNHCYYQQGAGLFVDQLWVTLAPLYFPGVHVEKDPGYNMCYWNHFERRLSRDNGRYLVNGRHELVFYHFSSYSVERPDVITKRSKARIMSFAERPDVRPIYEDYYNRLIGNDYAKVKDYKYSLRQNRPKTKRTPRTAARDGLRAALQALPRGCQQFLKAAAHFTINTFK
jgi:hypothetical protein